MGRARWAGNKAGAGVGRGHAHLLEDTALLLRLGVLGVEAHQLVAHELAALVHPPLLGQHLPVVGELHLGGVVVVVGRHLLFQQPHCGRQDPQLRPPAAVIINILCPFLRSLFFLRQKPTSNPSQFHTISKNPVRPCKETPSRVPEGTPYPKKGRAI